MGQAGYLLENTSLLRHLSALRAFSEQVINTLTDPLAVIDDQFRVVSCNARFSESFRAHANDYLWDRLALEPVQRTALAEVTVGGRAGGPLNEWILDERTFEPIVTPFAGDQSGRRFLLFLRDVTARRQMERRLVGAEKMASLGVLAAGGRARNQQSAGVREGQRPACRRLHARHALGHRGLARRRGARRDSPGVRGTAPRRAAGRSGVPHRRPRPHDPAERRRGGARREDRHGSQEFCAPGHPEGPPGSSARPRRERHHAHAGQVEVQTRHAASIRGPRAAVVPPQPAGTGLHEPDRERGAGGKGVGGASKSRCAGSTTRSRSRSPTPAGASPTTSANTSSSRSSRRRTSARAPVWAWPSPTTSSRTTVAGSGSSLNSASARRSGFACRRATKGGPRWRNRVRDSAFDARRVHPPAHARQAPAAKPTASRKARTAAGAPGCAPTAFCSNSTSCRCGAWTSPASRVAR
jgi:PAS domain-containing protein